MTPAANRPFRVQIICETALTNFKNIQLNVRHYAFTTGRIELVDTWYSNAPLNATGKDNILYLSTSDIPQSTSLLGLSEHVRKNRIDGLIVQVRDREMLETLKKIDIPIVDIGGRFADTGFPSVTQNFRLVGLQAAEHLMNCGGATFGFFGQKDALYSDEMKAGFFDTLKKGAPSAKIFVMEGNSILNESGRPLVRRMESWLKKLPYPIGIFTTGDTFGLHLMKAAQNIGLRVPEDVALIAASDDPYWVHFGSIPLSSVRFNPRDNGIEAAKLLEHMIRNGLRALPSRYVEGSSVSARRSTDVLFIQDAAIAKAVAYIRKNANKNIYVDEIAKIVGISRTGLYLRFKKAIGRSVLDEVRNARIRHVQMLLRNSDLQLTEIAELCDFADTSALHVMFRKVTGKTPAKYRAAFKQI